MYNELLRLSIKKTEQIDLSTILYNYISKKYNDDIIIQTLEWYFQIKLSITDKIIFNSYHNFVGNIEYNELYFFIFFHNNNNRSNFKDFPNY